MIYYILSWPLCFFTQNIEIFDEFILPVLQSVRLLPESADTFSPKIILPPCLTVAAFSLNSFFESRIRIEKNMNPVPENRNYREYLHGMRHVAEFNLLSSSIKFKSCIRSRTLLLKTIFNKSAVNSSDHRTVESAF